MIPVKMRLKVVRAEAKAEAKLKPELNWIHVRTTHAD
jgi:hypothetical protein